LGSHRGVAVAAGCDLSPVPLENRRQVGVGHAFSYLVWPARAKLRGDVGEDVLLTSDQLAPAGLDQRPEDLTIVACSEFQSGLRVFDIRNVHRPREIAHYNPGGDGQRPPGSFGGTYGGYTSAQPRILVDRVEIWFTYQDRGFYVVHFTNGAWPVR
jgi:hypothetical protein